MSVLSLLLCVLAIAIGLSCNPTCLQCVRYCITCNPTPRVFEVTFAGVANAFCADCEATWNATYILPISYPPEENRCSYRYPDISVIGFAWCGFPTWMGGYISLVVLYNPGTDVSRILVGVFNNLGPLAEYERTFPGKLDCDATANENIPLVSFEDGGFGARCTWVASTCHITIS